MAPGMREYRRPYGSAYGPLAGSHRPTAPSHSPAFVYLNTNYGDIAMKWTRKQLMQIARKNGYTGKAFTAGKAFAEWASDAGLAFDGLDTEADVIKTFEKMVTVTCDAGEEVNVVDATETMAVDPEEEIKAEGDAPAEEDDEELKAFHRFRTSEKAAMLRLQNGAANPAAMKMPGSKRIGDARSAKMLAYDRAIKNGTGIRVRGQKDLVDPGFYSAERAEYYGARARLGAMKSEGYSQRSNDEGIVNRFKGSTTSGTAYGPLVYYEELPELIENFNEYGAFRNAVGVTNMRDGEQTVGKLTADIVVYDTAEGAPATESDAAATNVKLVASKTSALALLTREVLDDSAFNLAEILARSSKRAMAKWEDDGAVNGLNNRQGVLSILLAAGANVLDAASVWSGITVADVQDTQALAPGWVYDDPNCGWMCSWAFAQSVFYRFGLDAGGNTGRDLQAGFRDRLFYNGFPIYINEAMNSAYAGDEIPLLFGAWSNACKFGVVNGSQEMRSSSDRYFEQDKIAFRYDQRWSHSLHGVKATGESGIVGLQD